MPIYEYECDACAHRAEIIQRFDDPPLSHCPRCGGTMRKLLSAPAFQFKGSGWYVTDYAGRGESKAGGAAAPKSGGEGTPEAKGAPPAEPKAEAKPEGRAAGPEVGSE
jgi:putative FmdB family regulatory protein